MPDPESRHVSATSILGHTINGTPVPVEGRLRPFLGSLKDIQGLVHLPRTQLALPTVHDEGMREIGINAIMQFYCGFSENKPIRQI